MEINNTLSQQTIEENEQVTEINNLLIKKSVIKKSIICFFGKSFSGKTTIINSLIFPTIIKQTKYIKTLSYDLRYLISDNLLIKIFDLGNFDINSNIKNLDEIFNNSQMIFYVIDASNLETINYIKIFTKLFDKNLYLILNKIDKEDAINKNNQEIKNLNEKYSFKNIFEISSTNENNIQNLKNFIISEINNNNFFINDEIFNKNPNFLYIKIKKQKEKKKKILCK
jgi:GTPase Era involved in 16S rRNA processing